MRILLPDCGVSKRPLNSILGLEQHYSMGWNNLKFDRGWKLSHHKCVVCFFILWTHLLENNIICLLYFSLEKLNETIFIVILSSRNALFHGSRRNWTELNKLNTAIYTHLIITNNTAVVEHVPDFFEGVRSLLLSLDTILLILLNSCIYCLGNCLNLRDCQVLCVTRK